MENFRKKEKGIALIAVMSILVLVGLLAASLTTLALITNQLSKVTVDMESSVYIAEGAVDRTIWLLRNDRSQHPTRSLGNHDYQSEEEESIDRFMADGMKHQMDYYGGKAVVQVMDAATGKDISGTSPERNIRRSQTAFEDDFDKWERYNNFLRALKDYVDRNDFVNPNGGMEEGDYADLGLSPLPRNNKLEFREEALLIPGAEEFFKPDKRGVVSALRIIPPLGMKQLRGKENFYSADGSTINTDGGFTETETNEIVGARDLWETEQIPLSESLNTDILSRVKSKYSMKESGFYTIYVDANPGENLPGKTLSVTIEVPVALTKGRDFQFYEWRFLK